MRAKLITAAAALMSLIALGHPLSADQMTPIGLWQAVDDDTKQPTGWFLIAEHDGIYAGIIAKMFLKPGENPNALCDQCKDDRHNHPWLGLEIIRGMKQEANRQEGNKFVDGTILDPRDGKIYKAMMTVTPDGQTLVVRGYIGFSLLGKNQYWTRLPDSAYSSLDPSINPNPPAKHPPSARKSEAAPNSQNSARR